MIRAITPVLSVYSATRRYASACLILRGFRRKPETIEPTDPAGSVNSSSTLTLSIPGYGLGDAFLPDLLPARGRELGTPADVLPAQDEDNRTTDLAVSEGPKDLREAPA